jgi:hypothetical protein
MNGESVDIYSSFKGTNNTINESNPLPADNQLYLLNNDYQSFLKMSNGAEGVQLAMSLVANILAKFTPEGELKVRLGLINSISIIATEPEPEPPTAISRLQADDGAVDTYDLRGCKVNPINLRTGVYIRNGKKIVIR